MAGLVRKWPKRSPFSMESKLKLRLVLRSAQSKGSFSRSFLRLGRTQTSFGSALGSIERFVFTFLSPPRQNSNFVWFCARLNRKVPFFELLQVLSGLFAGLQGKNKWLSRSGRFCLRTKARLLGCCMTTKRRHFFKIFIIKILWCNVKTFSHAGQRNVVCLYGSFFRSCLNLLVQACGRGFGGMAPRFSKEDSQAI